MTRLAIRPAFHFSSELDRLFSERPSRKYNWSPSVDTHEAKEAFVVTVELPGVSSEDVSIRLDDDTLTISGEKKRCSIRVKVKDAIISNGLSAALPDLSGYRRR